MSSSGHTLDSAGTAEDSGMGTLPMRQQQSHPKHHYDAKPSPSSRITQKMRFKNANMKDLISAPTLISSTNNQQKNASMDAHFSSVHDSITPTITTKSSIERRSSKKRRDDPRRFTLSDMDEIRAAAQTDHHGDIERQSSVQTDVTTNKQRTIPSRAVRLKTWFKTSVLGKSTPDLSNCE